MIMRQEIKCKGVKLLQNTNEKVEESKKILQEYGDALIQLKSEIEKKKQNIAELKKEYKRIPKFIRRILLKDKKCEMIIEG